MVSLMKNKRNEEREIDQDSFVMKWSSIFASEDVCGVHLMAQSN